MGGCCLGWGEQDETAGPRGWPLSWVQSPRKSPSFCRHILFTSVHMSRQGAQVTPSGPPPSLFCCSQEKGFL